SVVLYLQSRAQDPAASNYRALAFHANTKLQSRERTPLTDVLWPYPYAHWVASCSIRSQTLFWPLLSLLMHPLRAKHGTARRRIRHAGGAVLAACSVRPAIRAAAR